MALRFQRRITLAPGIRWNISGGGSSFSFGPRGASVSVGKRGTFVNAGLPGTGLSARGKLGGQVAPQARGAATKSDASSLVPLTCFIAPDGTITFVGDDGEPASDRVVEIAKKQNRAAIMAAIQQQCDAINDEVEALGRLHHATPDCRMPPRWVAEAFEEPEPAQPLPRKAPWLLRWHKRSCERAAVANRAAEEAYRSGREAWITRKNEHERREVRRRRLIEQEINVDVQAMQAFLDERLQAVSWPRETSVAFEIVEGGSKVLLDVDLPELEAMPSKTATVPARGLKLTVKDMPAPKVQKLYMEHVHGILFRLVGEVFAALPMTQTVVASGFTQRPDPATGHVQDVYVLSVRVGRGAWQGLAFGRLESVAAADALSRFEARSKPQRSGKLLAIEPFAS